MRFIAATASWWQQVVPAHLGSIPFLLILRQGYVCRSIQGIVHDFDVVSYVL